MTRKQHKSKVNRLLREATRGSFQDESWLPVHRAWEILHEAGYKIMISRGVYALQDGELHSKTWKFEIDLGKNIKPIPGILTAHAAGTATDPMGRYDISAYVS